jgi:hypothetical protein
MFSERRGDQRDWSITKPKLLIKWLCQPCNNGWMSRLEAKTKPIVTSILDETLSTIDTAAQTTLGVWAVKTAMVLQALDPDQKWFYTEGEREQMRLSHSVPPHTSVWIAKCVDHKDIYSAAKDHSTDDGVQAFSVTMAFGLLAFQVVTVKPPPIVPAHAHVTYEVSEGPWGEVLVPVWPVSQEARNWPGKQGLRGDAGLHALTERLTPSTASAKAD